MPDAQTSRPSVHSVERLHGAVRNETDDLRRTLTEALAEAERLEAAGRTDLAVALLEDQRDALLVAHERLERHVAGAMVEHEAEAALRSAAADAALPASTSDPVLPPVGALLPAPRLIGRVLASAAAALAGLALLLLPEPQPGTVGIAAAPPQPPHLTGQAVAAVGDDEDGAAAPEAPEVPAAVAGPRPRDGASTAATPEPHADHGWVDLEEDAPAPSDAPPPQEAPTDADADADDAAGPDLTQLPEVPAVPLGDGDGVVEG